MVRSVVVLAVLLMTVACGDVSRQGTIPQHDELRLKALVFKLDSTIATAISDNDKVWPSQYGEAVLAEYRSGKAQMMDCTVTFGFLGVGRHGIPERTMSQVADFDRATGVVTPRGSVPIVKVPSEAPQPVETDAAPEPATMPLRDDLSVRTRNGVVIVSMPARLFTKADNPRISAHIKGVNLVGAVGEFAELVSLPGNEQEGRENAILHAIRTGEEHLFILIVPQGTKCQ